MSSTLASRNGEWLDLVAELMATPLTGWPFDEVAGQLVATFRAPASSYYPASYPASAEKVPEQRGWPPGTSGARRSPMSRTASPTSGCWQPGTRRAAAGVACSPSSPAVQPGATRAIIIGRPDAYTVQEMQLARRLQRLLTGLDRQICAYARWAGQDEPLAVEAAACLHLTPRELAVLEPARPGADRGGPGAQHRAAAYVVAVIGQGGPDRCTGSTGRRLCRRLSRLQARSVAMLDVLDVMTRLGEVRSRTAEALRATEADPTASVVTVAVAREFDAKADKANRQPEPNGSARDSVIELEQAGDSAKAAAEADPDLGPAALQAVLDAHLAICVLKAEVTGSG
jgi:hypothetical protein